MKVVRVLLCVLSIGGSAWAHLSHAGRFHPTGTTSPRVHVIPQQNNGALLEGEDKGHGGYQFAAPLDVVLGMEEDGFWGAVEGGRVWSLTLRSEGATSLGVTFKDFYLPEGGELYIVGQEETRGAYTARSNPDPASARFFTTFPLKGEELTLEYFQPAEVDELPHLSVAKVAHGYRPLAFGDSGACNINVACDNGKWADQIRSVGMLLSGFGSRFCSGALVNNAENDGAQLFLTANHCSVDSGDLVMFNYQSASCSPNRDGPTSSTVGQVSRLASNVYSDFTLVRIGEPIPASWNVYLSGVSAENVAPASMVGIHHPSGDTKKISYANKQGKPGRWGATEPGNWHWEVSSWDQGTTEPGSSGSPLFDQNQRVVGQLHGGAASCANKAYDTYGAVWASWSNGLGQYLDPKSSGTTVINGTDLNALRH